MSWHERHLHRTQVQVRKINKKQLAIRNWRGMMDIIQAGYNPKEIVGRVALSGFRERRIETKK